MKFSTNALAARYCAVRGWPSETVQSWRGRRRHDAFGVGDSLVLQGNVALLIQNASLGTLKAHQRKIDASPYRKAIMDAGLILGCWEWRRKKLKRGGKNKSREWYMRASYATDDGWTPVTSWGDPMDLYPKKTKA